MTIKEESLIRALETSHMMRTGLPKRYDDSKGEIWIKAIVLVSKSNLEECYCLYSRSADGYMRLETDCGSGTGIIKTIISIHPYIYLDKLRFFPNVSYIEKRSMLKTNLRESPERASEVDMMSDEQVDIALINDGIRMQLENRETDLLNNIMSEGNDIDGTNFEEIADMQFEKDLADMKASGASKIDMKNFRAKYEEEKRERLALSSNTSSTSDYLSEADELRMEMETKDLTAKEAEKSVSVDGEFDAPEVDLEAIREASEQYRREQILISKRKFKRRYDGQDKFLNGKNIINELGEIEDIETISLPGNASKGQKKALEKQQEKQEQKAAREAALKAKQEAPKKKGGRPKGSKNKPKSTTTRKTTRKTSTTKK